MAKAEDPDVFKKVSPQACAFPAQVSPAQAPPGALSTRAERSPQAAEWLPSGGVWGLRSPSSGGKPCWCLSIPPSLRPEAWAVL